MYKQKCTNSLPNVSTIALLLKNSSPEPVTHSCNPSYSGDRDQEDHGSSQLGQIVYETISQKNPSQKRAGGVAQGVCPESSPGITHKKIQFQSFL
jgi:hypothetical protein